MSENFVIAGADNYTAAQIRPWCQSLRESGYNGRVIIVLYRHGQDVLDECKRWNIEAYPAARDSFEQLIQYGPETKAHNLRFYHMWELMNFALIEGKNVLVTDISDVVFQRNPFPHSLGESIIASSEGIKYKDEEWGANNLLQGFGPVIYEAYKNNTIYNVGVLFGPFDRIKNLCLQIYEMTKRNYYPSDQSSYNIILNSLNNVVHTNHSHAWACQIGTTADPTKSWLWERLIDSQPSIVDGKAFNPELDIEYCIVHQWNRNPELKQAILERYK